MGDMNFEKGGVHGGVHYPPLRPVELGAALRDMGEIVHSAYYQYEPGNATRYDVIFTTYRARWGQQTVMTVVNMKKCMVIPERLEWSYQLGYMQEKLELGAGDCYALMPLVNAYLEELGR